MTDADAMFLIRVAGTGIAFPCAASDTITRAALRAGVPLLYECNTGSCGSCKVELVSGGIDLAVVHDYSNVPRQLPVGVDNASIGSEPVWLATQADDPLAVDGVDLARFAERAWVTPIRSLTCFDMVDRACGLAGFRPTVVAETIDFSVQLELVRAGLGVALVPELAVGTLPTGVVLVRPRHQLERHLLAVTRAGQQRDPGITTLVDLLRSAMSARARPIPVGR